MPDLLSVQGTIRAILGLPGCPEVVCKKPPDLSSPPMCLCDGARICVSPVYGMYAH